MIIKKLIEEMTGRDGEFEHLSVLLPVPVATDVRDLANKMGVPASRLLTEIVSSGISEAQFEWRRLSIEQADVPQFHLKGPWEGGPIP